MRLVRLTTEIFRADLLGSEDSTSFKHACIEEGIEKDSTVRMKVLDSQNLQREDGT